MKRSLVAITMIFAAGIASQASAQEAEQVVTFEVQAINQISVGGSPSLTISTAVAGDAPTAVSDVATYAITTNEEDRKITAELDENMPTGLTLTIDMAAPVGSGLSTDVQTLSTDAVALVTGVSLLNESGLGISYNLSATSAAGVVSSSTRTVTFTVVAGA